MEQDGVTLFFNAQALDAQKWMIKKASPKD
jgi:hypothetical protein